MRKLMLLMFLVSAVSVAQEGDFISDTLVKPVIPIEKLGLLKDVDVLFHSRVGYESYFQNGDYMNSEFRSSQARIEIKGKVHDRVYFRFRQKLTQQSEISALDNLERGIDMAFLGVYLDENTRLDVGKVCADLGGYEFDFNPIYVLQFGDVLSGTDSFLTGVGVRHTFANKHALSFQVLNSRGVYFDKQYEEFDTSKYQQQKLPVALVGNWRGYFFDGKFETIYSYSYSQEVKGKAINYIALGHKYESDKLKVMYDFKYSVDGLDRKGIVTSMVNNQLREGEDRFISENVRYVDNWLRGEYKVTPKINALFTFMTSSAFGKNIVSDNSGSDLLRTSYGFIPTVEYVPFKDIDLRFYIGYVARSYKYSSYAKSNLGLADYNTGRLSVGVLVPLLLL